jgi:hypothetical protein
LDLFGGIFSSGFSLDMQHSKSNHAGKIQIINTHIQSQKLILVGVIEYLQELLQIFVDYIVHQKSDLIVVQPNFLFSSPRYLFQKKA